MAGVQQSYDPAEDYPDFSKHNNHMAKVLTKEMYAKLQRCQNTRWLHSRHGHPNRCRQPRTSLHHDCRMRCLVMKNPTKFGPIFSIQSSLTVTTVTPRPTSTRPT